MCLSFIVNSLIWSNFHIISKKKLNFNIDWHCSSYYFNKKKWRPPIRLPNATIKYVISLCAQFTILWDLFTFWDVDCGGCIFGWILDFFLNIVQLKFSSLAHRWRFIFKYSKKFIKSWNGNGEKNEMVFVFLWWEEIFLNF